MLLEQLSKTSRPQVCEASSALPIASGRFESRKLYGTKHLVHEPRNLEMSKFLKKLALVRGSGF